jgi:DNA polymerase (family 10)
VTNRAIARKLIAHAHLLEEQNAGLYRIRAYRRAAETILRLNRPLTDIVALSGPAGLLGLPGIGRRIAEMLQSLLTADQFQSARAGQPALPYRAELSDASSHGS